MRLFLVFSLVMSFSAFAQQSRVRENIKQSTVNSSDQPEKNLKKQRPASKKENNERKRGQ